MLSTESPALGTVSDNLAAESGIGHCHNGAQGRIRTTDTAIFSRMLYQLSYPGMSRRGAGSAGL